MNDDLSVLQTYAAEHFNGKSDETKKTYVKEIELFKNWLEPTGANLTDFSRVDVQYYINWLTSRKLAAATINKKFRAITHFCHSINKENCVADIRVMKSTKHQLAPKSLKKTEKHSMIRKASRSENKRDFAVIMFLLNTGVRVQECYNLDIESIVDFGEKKGFIRVVGKGNKDRIIPLNSDVRHALLEYLAERKINLYELNKLPQHVLEEPLFLSNRKQRLAIRTIQYLVGMYGGTHPHALRHTFATDLIREQKADVTAVAQLLGQNGLETVKRYTLATDEERADIVEKLTISNIK